VNNNNKIEIEELGENYVDSLIDLLKIKEEELSNLQDKYDDLQRMYNEAKFNYDAISNAFFWKVSGPLRRTLDKGKSRFRRNIYARRIWHALKWICYKGKIPEDYNLQPAATNLIYNPDDPMTIMCTKHTWFIGQLIQNSLKKAGIDADILTDEPTEYSEKLHIVVCPQMFRRLPGKYISFQMEQTISSRWLNETYFDLLESSYAVFDYSLKNIEYFRKTVGFSRMFYYLPVDYLPGIRMETGDYKYDVVFYGDPNNSRRQAALKKLKHHFNIKILSEVFGEELYSELSRARVVVNIHYYENAMLETTRLYETLSLGKSVIVSERSVDSMEDERLEGIVDFVPVDDFDLMIDKISYWLSHEEERRAAVERNNELFIHHSSAFDYYFLRFLLANDWLSFDEFYRLAGDYVNFDTNHICISLPESMERGKAFREEIRDKNIGFELFPALRHRRGWTGCGLSYKFIMKKAQEQNMDSILICEDDVFLPDDFDYRWGLCEAYLNKHDDWDIFQGIMSDIGDVTISAVHKELGQTFIHMDHMISAVFNYYRKNMFERVLSWDEKNDDVNSNTFDRVLESQELRVVCTDPFLVGHKDDLYSDVWGFRNYQYKSLIEDSSRKLNSMVKKCGQHKISEGECAEPVKFSIVVPLYNTDTDYLREMIESVQEQLYAKWELCLVDGNKKTDTVTEKICREYAEADSRIKYKRTDDKGMAELSNAAVSMTEGDYICLLDQEDIIHPAALLKTMASAYNGADFIYTDEALFESAGKDSIMKPLFKPDFGPDSLNGNNYIAHFTTFKKSLLDETGGFRSEYGTSYEHELFLRLTDAAKQITHIPEVLYYSRADSRQDMELVLDNQDAFALGAKAVEDNIRKKGIAAAVEPIGQYGPYYRVHYPIIDHPKISIIIPNYEHLDDLRKCLESIIQKSTYDNYEIVIVENNSKSRELFDYYDKMSLKHDNIKIVEWEGKFNYSAINNYGINKAADGDYLLLLNNDTEIITPEWMEEMLMYAQRDEVGAVGAKLYYPDDGAVQHAGVIVGLGGVAGHISIRSPRDHAGYMGRNIYAQNLSAVTAACIMIRKDVWEKTGGLDEDFEISYNDIDLCLKIRKAGYLIVWTPFAELYHYESKSRGRDITPEMRGIYDWEAKLFRKRWAELLGKGDPYYNPNLTLWRLDYTPKAHTGFKN